MRGEFCVPETPTFRPSINYFWIPRTIRQGYTVRGADLPWGRIWRSRRQPRKREFTPLSRRKPSSLDSTVEEKRERERRARSTITLRTRLTKINMYTKPCTSCWLPVVISVSKIAISIPSLPSPAQRWMSRRATIINIATLRPYVKTNIGSIF